ncbi:fimbrial protein [Providencia rettgeri]
MTSQTQSLVLGNLDTSELQQQGKGKSVPLQLVLEDCLETATHITDSHTGIAVWSSSQPGVKVRFLAPSVPGRPSLAKVTGAQGLGLQLSNVQGQQIVLGEATTPQLVPSGQTTLTYYVTPVRTGLLQPGRYSALIAFEMLYD